MFRTRKCELLQESVNASVFPAQHDRQRMKQGKNGGFVLAIKLFQPPLTVFPVKWDYRVDVGLNT